MTRFLFHLNYYIKNKNVNYNYIMNYLFLSIHYYTPVCVSLEPTPLIDVFSTCSVAVDMLYRTSRNIVILNSIGRFEKKKILVYSYWFYLNPSTIQLRAHVPN